MYLWQRCCFLYWLWCSSCWWHILCIAAWIMYHSPLPPTWRGNCTVAHTAWDCWRPLLTWWETTSSIFTASLNSRQTHLLPFYVLNMLRNLEWHCQKTNVLYKSPSSWQELAKLQTHLLKTNRLPLQTWQRSEKCTACCLNIRNHNWMSPTVICLGG